MKGRGGKGREAKSERERKSTGDRWRVSIQLESCCPSAANILISLVTKKEHVGNFSGITPQALGL